MSGPVGAAETHRWSGVSSWLPVRTDASHTPSLPMYRGRRAPAPTIAVVPGRRHRPNNAAKLAKRREQRARRRDREARERAAELAAMGADLVRIRDPDPEEAALAFERVFASAPPPLKWTVKLFDELGSDRSRALA